MVTRILNALARGISTGGSEDYGSYTFGVENPWQPQAPEVYLHNNVAVYTCSNLRATLVSSVPMEFYRGYGETRKQIGEGPLVELFSKVNPFWTFRRLIQVSVHSLDLTGQCFWYIARKSKSGIPVEIWFINPQRMRVVPSETEYLSHFLYTPPGKSEPIRMEVGEVFWARFPDPMDEYGALAPLTAARLAADTQQSASKTNYQVFKNGSLNSGVIMPDDDEVTWTKKQADDLQLSLDDKLKGASKAHRIVVMREAFKFTPLTMSPADAQFIELSKWNLEDVARVYGIPLDLIGGQRTFENVDASLKIVWAHTIVPLLNFLADEITEQILPMFNILDGCAEFDLSEVEALNESASSRWNRAKEQFVAKAIVVNEWRAEQGKDPLPWGDAAWQSMSEKPLTKETFDVAIKDVVDPPDPIGLGPGTSKAEGEEEDPYDEPEGSPRWIFGGNEHRRIIGLFNTRTAPLEEQWLSTVRSLFRRQKQSILTELALGSERSNTRSTESVAQDPFDQARWKRVFRVEGRGLVQTTLRESGTASSVDLGLSFNVSDPNVIRAVENRSQKFSEQVNQTTYNKLKSSLAEGVKNGESYTQMKSRVESVMDGRIRSDAATIARTEVQGAYNEGQLLSWQQGGAVEGKRWLAALDARCRETHRAAHGQEVGLNELFMLGVGEDQRPVVLALPERTSTADAQ